MTMCGIHGDSTDTGRCESRDEPGALEAFRAEVSADRVSRSLAAEVRAVEEGHRAFVQEDGSIKVVSDTRPGKWYRVTFTAPAVGDPITFYCQPEGTAAYSDDHKARRGNPGTLACKHAAVAARRLEREGLATMVWVERLGLPAWVTTERAARMTPPEKKARLAPPADPFDGLPQ